MLNLTELHVGYGGAFAVRDVSLTVQPGEFVALIGSNGAGKTTILKAISGLLKPASGSIVMEQKRIDGLPAHRVARLGIAHVPEGRRVFPDLTVRENLEMGGFIWRNEHARFNETMTMVLDLFPKLAQRRNQLAGTLSGGEQQMLAVGRALMTRPRLLLLDEPSLGLAPKLVAEMFEFLARLHQETKLAILLVEQLAVLTLELAERGYVLEHGHIVLEGPCAALRNNSRIQQIYLGATAE
jgi:branched-chain amino acid transport system ATP-binding protein